MGACAAAAVGGPREGDRPVTAAIDPGRARDALAQRLHAVAGAVLDGSDRAHGAPPEDPITLLEEIAAHLRSCADPARVWLLLTGVVAAFPSAELVRTAVRRIEHLPPRDAVIWLLRYAGFQMSSADAAAEIELVTDRPVVDVDFSASNDLSTGIQRVVRNLVPRWVDTRPLTLVRWTEAKMFVGLSDVESARVLGEGRPAAPGSGRRIVPWRVPVLLPEVPFPGHGDRLAGLARYSANVVRAIGYDCIPIVSSELVWDAEREKFGEYLEMVKFVDLVAGISLSAAAEFEGFTAALDAQGLDGPKVVACSLPTTETVPSIRSTTSAPDLPEVLCVGSLDRRKNQIALVEAAEHLWRVGVRFRLRLLGSGGGQPAELMNLIQDLVDEGRPVDVRQKVSDDVLSAAYRRARVVVFPTLHEGFGLPVVEALSYGVPVITSDFGSTREIGAGQGAVLVDPEDVGQLTAALRRLLTSDDAHAELVAQARAREQRTWDDYAADLWQVFVP
jgi:glycosyltransferase involved in cell wall biosynthesis